MRPRTPRTPRGFAPPLLVLLALLALTRAPSASAGVAGGASGSFVSSDASDARGAARASPPRVDVAGSSARVTATPGEPFARAAAVEVRGFSRLAQPHKAFHHVTLEVFDDARSSFARNECELRLADGRPLRARRGPGWPRKRDIARKYLTAANERTERETHANAIGPALVVDLGPFAKARVVATCGRDASIPATNEKASSFEVTFKLTSEESEVRHRRWRFIAGAALTLFAPRISDVAAAYYLAGAVTGVAALTLFFAAKLARAAPGGRAARAGAGVAAVVSAFVVPPEHVSKVFEVYLSLWLAPARLALAAAGNAFFPSAALASRRAGAGADGTGAASTDFDLSASPPASEFAALAYALLCTAVTLAGAGAGLWATRAWVIDARTGDVAAPVASFARVAARALGAVLLRFCTLDAAFGGALASVALVAALAEHARGAAATASLVFRSPRGDGRGGRSSERFRGASSRDSDDDFDDDDHLDDDDDARGLETTRTPRSRGSRGRSSASPQRRVSGSGSDRGGVRRRKKTLRESDEDARDFRRAGPRGASPQSARSPGWNWFGGTSRSRQTRRRRGDAGTAGTGTPTTLDPEPRTPPVVLVGTGAGALGASPGRTPGFGLRPWLAASFASPFAFSSSSSRGARHRVSRDSDSEDDADGDALLRERHRAAAAAAAASARRVETKAGGGRSGRQTSPANPVPVGMAARARGRFMTRAEYDALGAESTDRGLDELCGTPEFAKWMAKQSHRVRLVATDLDSDEEYDG